MFPGGNNVVMYIPCQYSLIIYFLKSYLHEKILANELVGTSLAVQGLRLMVLKQGQGFSPWSRNYDSTSWAARQKKKRLKETPRKLIKTQFLGSSKEIVICLIEFGPVPWICLFSRLTGRVSAIGHGPQLKSQLFWTKSGISGRLFSSLHSQHLWWEKRRK